MSDEIREQFPLLQKPINGKPLVYLDSAATAQRPQAVLDAVEAFYQTENANPHRGLYDLALRATDAYEAARKRIAQFLNAPPEEVIFTRNASESLNLLAYSWGMANLHAGDRVVISILEHHSNLVPWQQVCRATGAKLEYLYTDQDGILPDSEIEKKITKGVKMVSITHVSNVLGLLSPVEKVIARAHAVGALCAVDGAQSVPHMRVDVQKLGADFLAFSGHKLYAPMGIGVLWGRRELLEAMPPFLTGGEMIEDVSEQEATWAPLPQKFEAGTQNAGGAIGLAAAIDWMEKIGMDQIERREADVMDYALDQMLHCPHIVVYGDPTAKRHGSIAFNVEDGQCLRARRPSLRPATAASSGSARLRTRQFCRL